MEKQLIEESRLVQASAKAIVAEARRDLEKQSRLVAKLKRIAATLNTVPHSNKKAHR